jgi:cation:H+ antiporter
MILTITFLVIGFVILIKGADFLVNGASSAAKRYGVSNLAIGLTVVAFGTSMPELVVSVLAAVSGQNDASFGNVIGSNNFNLLLILGLSGVISPLVVQKSTVRVEIPISLLAAGFLFFLVNDSLIWQSDTNVLSRLDSLFLLIGFAGFLYYVYTMMAKTPEDDNGSTVKQYSLPVSAGLVLLGLLMLMGGGKLVIDNAIAIATHYGLSEKLIGLTILAAGTSLPELATSVVAALKRNTDIAIGNVIGSNIFNILFILGTTGLIHPVSYNLAMNTDLLLLMIGTVVLMIFMFTLHQNKLDRWEAFILIAAYVVYTLYLIRMG